MKKLLTLIGIPCSGKSTFAIELIKKDSSWVRINRDDIRMSLFGKEFDLSIEGLVSQIQTNLIQLSLKNNRNVVVDNCHVKLSYRNELKKIAESVGDVLYEEKVFNTDLDVCLERNLKRDRKVPEDIILKYYKLGKDVFSGKYKPVVQFYPRSEIGYSSLQQDLSLSKAILCDLDGTLAILNGRNPYDASTCDQDLPNIPVLETIKMFHDSGYKIIFCSGREDKYKEPTVKFIETYFTMKYPNSDYDIPRGYQLFMRKSGDQRKDSIIKEEIFNTEIRDKYCVLLVLDDRNQVVDKWRELGLTCFQVNYGDF